MPASYIFISHSSRDEKLTKDLCIALKTPERTYEPVVDFEVLVDYKSLVSGVHWPRQLHQWMAKCHAAVLLLTQNAVCSSWVLKEATILAWRLSLDSQFHLFTIRFPDVTDEILTRARFDPLNLGEVQRINEQSTDQIALHVREVLGAVVPKRTPFDRLVGRLSDLFAQVGESTVKDIAETICVAPPVWRPDIDLRRQYVDEIAARLLSENLGGYQGVDDLIEELSSTPVEIVTRIFDIVSPYWVDAEAAGRLPALTRCNPRRAAAMNGAKVGAFTAERYVRRAHPLSNRYRVIPTAGGFPGGLVNHYTDEICKYIRQRENSNDSNETIIAKLKKLDPFSYVVIEGLPDKESLDALLGRFPTVTFILWTGETLQRDESLRDVEWLTPELDLDEEEKQEKDFQDALVILDPSGPRHIGRD
jgi:hypothetical protein